MIATVQRSLPSFGPNQLLLIERLMGTLDAFVSIDENLALTAMLNSYIEGTVREEISSAREFHRSGLSESEWMARSYPYVDQLVRSGKYPIFHQDRHAGAPAAPEPRRSIPARAPTRS